MSQTGSTTLKIAGFFLLLLLLSLLKRFIEQNTTAFSKKMWIHNVNNFKNSHLNVIIKAILMFLKITDLREKQ